MEKIQTFFSDFFSNLGGVLSSFDSLSDVLDVLLVALLFYALLIQLRKTQSVHIIRGILLLTVLYAVVFAFDMTTSKYVFTYFIKDILLIIVIIFSSEIRHALERMGHSRFKNLLPFTIQRDDSTITEVINATVRACASMSEDRIGSLIVFRRKSNLGELEHSGVEIDARVTTEMLCSIFFPKAALHDGAIVIDGDRITAARCIIPMNNNINLEKVGTRHRAAVSISQTTDAVAVVTSEETGIISIAKDGKLVRGVTSGELREALTKELLPDNGETFRLTGRLKKLLKKGGGARNGKEDGNGWDEIEDDKKEN